MYTRENLSVRREIKEMLLADIVLIIAIAFTLTGGIGNISKPGFLFQLLLLLPISAVGVTLSFVLHELMHKFVAQHYGAVAGFQSSRNGLLITLVTGFFGFLLGIPGATIIYAQRFTKRQNGLVSIAGPLTNLSVFLVFLAVLIILHPAGYLLRLIQVVLFISIILAFFNMLPITPLDGSKVLAWNPYIYAITMGVIFVLTIFFTGISLFDILFIFIIALVFSLFYRNFI